MKAHRYCMQLVWTGNTGTGTSSYRSYKRDHELANPGKAPIPGSSDPAFRGDASRYNPEELLVAALSACHMLWYLHLCADSGIAIKEYEDAAEGTMVETEDGGGHFREVILKPRTVIPKNADIQLCKQLHDRAHHFCFIANSVNFPVRCEPEFITHD